MHSLTKIIIDAIPVQGCDKTKLDEAIKKWCHKQLMWLENGDTSIQRIRKAFNGEEKKIIRNAVFCRMCGTEIESHHRHDFVTCPCGRVSADGGKEYLRRAYKDKDDYEERSVYA